MWSMGYSPEKSGANLHKGNCVETIQEKPRAMGAAVPVAVNRVSS